MKSFFVLITIIFIVVGCYDPKLRMKIYNNSKYDIKIYDKIIQKNHDREVGFEDRFQLKYKTGNKDECYLYVINSYILFDDRLHDLYQKYHFPSLKLQIDDDKKLYLVFPDIEKFPVDKKELDKMQINGFPISPTEVDCKKE